MSSQYDSHKNYKSMEDYVNWIDIESGLSTLISRQTYNAINGMHERMKKIINPDGLRNGTIIIASTVADDSNPDDYKNIWNEFQKEKK